MKRFWRTYLIGALLTFFLVVGCTTYRARPLPFRPPHQYPNFTQIERLQVAARAFGEKQEARDNFGFDVHGAGLLPVQVVFENRSVYSWRVVSNQTFLEDDSGQYWELLSKQEAHARLTRWTQLGNILESGAYHGMIGAAAGALIGAAVGIGGGTSVGGAIGQGAAIGAATGGTVGMFGGYDSVQSLSDITRDLRHRTMRSRSVKPQELTHGVLFFPREIKSAKRLRLQLQTRESGRRHTIVFELAN